MAIDVIVTYSPNKNASKIGKMHIKSVHGVLQSRLKLLNLLRLIDFEKGVKPW